MTRSAQKIRQTTDTVTEVQSVTLVRNILRSSLSSIAYLRYLFPEDNFQDTELAGLKIKSLVEGQNKEIAAMNKWLEQGVFDALEKHYLKALVFSIFAKFNDPSSLLESYTFKFSYPNDGNVSLNFTAAKGNDGKPAQTLSFMTKEQIQQAWCTMIRTLITLSHTLPPLPNERHIAMRLYYYEDVTPENYNPPGFTMADDAPDFEFIDESERIEIGGSVQTKYHTVSMRLDTAMPNYQMNNPATNAVSKMDMDMIQAIVVAFEENNISVQKIADSIGVPRNNERAVNTFKKLMEMGLISKNKGKILPEKTPENLDIYQEAKRKLENV